MISFDKLPTVTKISMLMIKLQKEILAKETTILDDFHKVHNIHINAKKLVYLVASKLKE